MRNKYIRCDVQLAPLNMFMMKIGLKGFKFSIIASKIPRERETILYLIMADKYWHYQQLHSVKPL